MHEVKSHRLLRANDLGSQGPGLHGCVVLSRHSRLSERQPPSGTETTFTLWIEWQQHNTRADIRSRSGTEELLCHSISNRDKHLDNLQGQCHQNVKACSSKREKKELSQLIHMDFTSALSEQNRFFFFLLLFFFKRLNFS